MKQPGVPENKKNRFWQMVEQDLENVFMNTDELATVHTIDGKEATWWKKLAGKSWAATGYIRCSLMLTG